MHVVTSARAESHALQHVIDVRRRVHDDDNSSGSDSGGGGSASSARSSVPSSTRGSRAMMSAARAAASGTVAPAVVGHAPCARKKRARQHGGARRNAGRPQSSAVWQVFERIRAAAGDRRRCRLCGNESKYGQQTSNMWQHLRRRHPAVYDQLRDGVQSMGNGRKRRRAQRGDSGLSHAPTLSADMHVSLSTTPRPAAVRCPSARAGRRSQSEQAGSSGAAPAESWAGASANRPPLARSSGAVAAATVSHMDHTGGSAGGSLSATSDRHILAPGSSESVSGLQASTARPPAMPGDNVAGRHAANRSHLWRASRASLASLRVFDDDIDVSVSRASSEADARSPHSQLQIDDLGAGQAPWEYLAIDGAVAVAGDHVSSGALRHGHHSDLTDTATEASGGVADGGPDTHAVTFPVSATPRRGWLRHPACRAVLTCVSHCNR